MRASIALFNGDGVGRFFPRRAQRRERRPPRRRRAMDAARLRGQGSRPLGARNRQVVHGRFDFELDRVDGRRVRARRAQPADGRVWRSTRRPQHDDASRARRPPRAQRRVDGAQADRAARHGESERKQHLFFLQLAQFAAHPPFCSFVRLIRKTKM